MVTGLIAAAEILVLLEGKGNSFEPVFAEYGHVCRQITPPALGSPFCPPFRLLVVPSAFADPKFYGQIEPALVRCAEQIGRFVERGGVVLVYGPFYKPAVETYEYPWLPGRCRYRYLPRKDAIKVIMPENPAARFVRPGTIGCDGYFEEYEGDAVLADAEGRPVLVVQQRGEGYVVRSGTFHYPEKPFVDWACGPGKKPVQL